MSYRGVCLFMKFRLWNARRKTENKSDERLWKIKYTHCQVRVYSRDAFKSGFVYRRHKAVKLSFSFFPLRHRICDNLINGAPQKRKRVGFNDVNFRRSCWWVGARTSKGIVYYFLLTIISFLLIKAKARKPLLGKSSCLRLIIGQESWTQLLSVFVLLIKRDRKLMMLINFLTCFSFYQLLLLHSLISGRQLSNDIHSTNKKNIIMASRLVHIW